MGAERRDDLRRTFELADAALAYLRRHKLPVTPRHFEVGYAHAAGLAPALSQQLTKTLDESGELTPEDLQSLHRTHISPSAPIDRIDEIGGEIVSDINDIAVIVRKLLAETAECGARLAATLAEIDADSAASTQAAAFLADVSRNIEDGRRILEERLADANSRFDMLRFSLETIRVHQLSDPLTTLATREHFDLAIEQAVEEAAAEKLALALMITDIDHFKSFNDRYGHQTGDQVLQLVAMSTKQNIKGQDTACRYGGEEFAIILPLTTEIEAALVGEHIRQAVMARELVKRTTGERIGHVTLSAGIACYRAGDTPQSLIERADACLYAAKRAGRNRILSESELATSTRDVA